MLWRLYGGLGACFIVAKRTRCHVWGARLCFSSASNGHGDFSALSRMSYWQQYYRHQRQSPTSPPLSDWLADSAVLVPELRTLLPKAPYIIVDVGCGVSSLSVDLILHSPQPGHAVCVDISRDALCILRDQLDAANTCSLSGCVQFVQADILHLPLQSGTVDVVLDKGTMDSLLKDQDRDRARSQALRLYKECVRVLQPSGTLIQVTDEDPDLRLSLIDPLYHTDPHLKALHVSHRTLELQHSRELFLYTVQKG